MQQITFCLMYCIVIFFVGMDIRLWKQAQADNPDPDNYIPVPIIGFSEVIIKYKIVSLTFSYY